MLLGFLLVLLTATTTGRCAYTWYDCLVAVSNSTDGIEVKISCGRDPWVHRQNFPGAYLSSINRNAIWVENVTAPEVNVTTVRYALILPLQSNVGVLELQYNSSTRQWASDFSLLGGINLPCQTHFIQKVFDTLLTVCIYPVDTARSNVKVHKIVLNTTLLQDSTVQVQNYASFDESFDFTNVAYASLGTRRHNQLFLFVRDGIISCIIPLEHGIGSSSALLVYFDYCDNFTCTSVHYVPGTNLLIHCHCCITSQSCTPYGIYYDASQGELDTNYPPRIGALLYPCPDSETTILVNKTSHNFWVQGKEYNLEGSGFREGLCSGDSSATWFAYQDDTGQIFATEISSDRSPTFHMLSEDGCLDPNCSPITNVSNVLVIQQKTSDGVVARGIKPKSNFSVEYEVNSSQPIFFALVNYPSTIQLIPSSPVQSPTPLVDLQPTPMVKPSPLPSSTPKGKDRGNEYIALYTALPVVVIIFIVIVISLVLAYIKKTDQPKRKRSIGQSNGCLQLQTHTHPQPTTNDEGDKDVVVSMSPLVDPTMMNPTTVVEKHRERRRNEESNNDLINKSNLLQQDN